MANALWLTVSHTIGGEDTSGSTAHESCLISSQYAFRDLPLMPLLCICGALMERVKVL